MNQAALMWERWDSSEVAIALPTRLTRVRSLVGTALIDSINAVLSDDLFQLTSASFGKKMADLVLNGQEV